MNRECTALRILRGTMFDHDDAGQRVPRVPRCTPGASGRCIFCEGDTR